MVSQSIDDVEEALKEMDLKFNKLQMNQTFFACEIVFAVYILINLALIAEKFLMPSLFNISRKYNMS